MSVAVVVMSIGDAMIPLAPSGAVVIGAAFLIGQQLIGDSAGTVYEVVERSVTQSIVDGRILGRVNATIEFVTTFLALVGSILGGVVAEVLGLRAALVVGVLGGATAILFVWLSPVRTMVGIPEGATLAGPRAEDLPAAE
jgi:MFS family permease